MEGSIGGGLLDVLEDLCSKESSEKQAAEFAGLGVEEQVAKFNEVSLLGQPFVKDPDQTVEKLLKAAKASVKSFERLEVGAGIEKKQDDFVGEVMAQVKASAGAPPPGAN